MSGKKHDIVSKEIEQVEREILANKFNTAMKKVQFINELKGGLGAEIKTNPSNVKIIKKPLLAKVKDYLIKIFTKF